MLVPSSAFEYGGRLPLAASLRLALCEQARHCLPEGAFLCSALSVSRLLRSEYAGGSMGEDDVFCRLVFGRGGQCVERHQGVLSMTIHNGVMFVRKEVSGCENEHVRDHRKYEDLACNQLR